MCQDKPIKTTNQPHSICHRPVSGSPFRIPNLFPIPIPILILVTLLTTAVLRTAIQNLLARENQPLSTKDALAPDLGDAVRAVRQQHLALGVEAQRPGVRVRVRQRAC